jgi:glutathione synthase/RimK-type ligase-like ATP-grasp enzyme
VVRLNTERAPNWKLTLRPTGGWRVGGARRSIESDDCVGVWWRRPEVPAVSTATGAADAIADQWRTLIAALANVAGPTWVSEPTKIRAAEDKSRQLRHAAATGLLVPDTLWTNDLEEARAFVKRWHGKAVAKSVASAWWEEEDRGRFVFASLVRGEDLPAVARLASAPVCFQQPIVPKRDIRVTVVGDVVLSAIRDAVFERPGPLDWRREPEREWSPYVLAVGVADACRELVDGLGLRFGGIDLVLDESGALWFLELNPNGEWGWLQRAGLPIAEALADALLSPAR